MDETLYYFLAAAGGLVMLIVAARGLMYRLLTTAFPTLRDDATPRTPFSEEGLARSVADGQGYDLQQAIRKATRLVHQGRRPDAVAVLRAAYEKADDAQVRRVLAEEIGRLGGEVPAPASRPDRPAPNDDPYEDRLD